MIYGLLITLFVLVCFFLVLIILVQKGKSSMGIGAMGGGSQLLFGGSGGQNLFQKTTWTLGTLFMVGSLLITLIKKPSSNLLSNLEKTTTVQTQKDIKEQAENTK